MRVRRVEVVDVYVEDGRAAVYSTRGMVVLLSELATTAWSVIGEDRWVTSSDVTAALIAEHGDPGDGNAGQLTEDALRSLAELSLVEVDESEVTGD
jgi:hypothetical protein